MKLKAYSADGSEAGEKEVAGFPTFDDDKGVDALRQAILAIRANRRQGNASTKNRAEVSGSGKKLYRQKGLGAGRVGDKRAGQRRGGGIAFGPKPRSFNQKVNRKVKRLALARALFEGADEGRLALIDEWKVEQPKTKLFVQVIDKVVPDSKRVLIVDDAFSDDFGLAARNVSRVALGRAQDLNPLDLATAENVVFSTKALDVLLAKLGEESES